MNDTTAAGARRALIIANDTYDHASLGQLRAPEADARALAAVLGDPEIGGFEVSIVHNAASYEVQSHIDDLFTESRPDDLLLLHFSGHGLKSDSGELFVAARNTRPDRLGSTAVPADFIQRCMRTARARTIVLFLDCCYGGAFGEGVAVRAAGPVNVMESFPAGRLGGGRGRAVISASSAMEYAFEGTTLTTDHEVQPSVFTSAVVHGLLTGEADRDEDGLVSLGELYDYVFDRVREQNPRQTPGRDVEMSGDVYLAKSRHKKVRPVPIPEAIVAALREPDPTYRRGAVVELRDRLGHPDLGVALGALEALQAVARADTKSVADDAAAVIDASAPRVSPPALDFGEIAFGAAVAVERELHVAGVPLAREVRVEADPPLSAVVDGSVVTVTFSPTDRPYAGSITVTSPTGSVIVPVTASVGRRTGFLESPPHPPEPAATAASVTDPASHSGPDDEEFVGRRLRPVETSRDDASVSAPASGESATVVGPTAAPAEAESVSPPQPSAPPATPATPDERAVPSDPSTQPDPVTAAAAHRTTAPAWRRVAGGATLLGGLLVLLTIFLPWFDGGTYADNAREQIPAAVIRGLLALTAGVTMLVPRVRDPVAVALLTSTGAACGAGSLTLVGVFNASGADRVDIGWLVALVGELLVGATALGTLLAVASRTRVPFRRFDQRAWRSVVTLCLGIATTAVFIAYAIHVADQASTYWGAVTLVWGLLTLAFTVSAVLLEAAVGRALLGGWAVGALSYSVSEWVYLNRMDSDPHAVPVLTFACGLLLLAAAALRDGSIDGPTPPAT
ncbi:caspase family protein [Terrabacter sp. RAF57]|uniref:caspase family protein n=1 Tax=Terrabacter sp. RAF57 TaxID=3233063 RepID=UPI003F9A3623